ncbi:LlaJI family restriction endonuclease [Thomasclavelia cocleata]|uniref:LlaJI family restriction endonuclease n=1 Tax=Thomasclavelia cocleata TaxID=69824 RepID=UPI00248CE811|nr:LlaJI family restriction endonuclease [Thomasclavelia cocleata]
MNNENNELKLIPVENSNKFMGIKINKNKIEVYVPKIYRKNLNEKKKRQELLKFLDSISLAKNLNNDNIELGDNDFVGEMWPIESFLWIIKDYFENGYFYNSEKKYSKDNKGKIDWKRTLKTIPIYSGGNIIYDELITSKLSSANDVVAEIYKLCLSISLKRIGWVFNYNFKVSVQQYKSNIEMVYIIKNEFNSTFDDIKRLRFKHMLKILNGIGKDNMLTNKTVYGITNYYYVVEQMIDKMFMGIDSDELKKYYPYGYWDLGDKPISTSLLRPDTICRNNGKIYIIDSKMYKYGYTAKSNHLPQTSDILKQVTYGEFIRNKCGYENIRNIFLIPYNKELDNFKDHDDLVYLGKAYGKWDIQDKLDTHNYIFTFLIDYNYLLLNYNKHDSKNIEKLCERVESLLADLGFNK